MSINYQYLQKRIWPHPEPSCLFFYPGYFSVNVLMQKMNVLKEAKHVEILEVSIIY